MIRIEINQRTGLGSLWSILMSQLAKLDPATDVQLFANSTFYAEPGVNIFDWFFENREGIPDFLMQNVPLDANEYPFNTRLGENLDQVAKLRNLRDRYFRPLSDLPLQAEAIIPAGCFGIHYRAIDKAVETPRMPVESVLRGYKTLGAGRQAFLSSDDQEATAWLLDRIPGLIVNNHLRASGPEGVYSVHGGLHHAHEAMLDVYCLARCESLLLGRGNFSDMGLIFGESNDVRYLEDFA